MTVNNSLSDLAADTSLMSDLRYIDVVRANVTSTHYRTVVRMTFGDFRRQSITLRDL